MSTRFCRSVIAMSAIAAISTDVRVILRIEHPGADVQRLGGDHQGLGQRNNTSADGLQGRARSES